MVSEDRTSEGIASALSIADNITLTRLEPLGPLFTVLPSRQNTAAWRWIDGLDIRCTNPRQPARELSGGNQQKVAVARLLHHDVDVLVLDEPTRGIDVASKVQIYKLIDELVLGPSKQKAVLLVSSYLPELLGVCDRIAVMSRGRLGPARSVSEWNEHSLLMEASGARVAM
jgi:ribose transport system ATP-binding protein